MNIKYKQTKSFLLFVFTMFSPLFVLTVSAQTCDTIIIGTIVNQLPVLPQTIKIGKSDVQVKWDNVSAALFNKTFEKVIIKGNASNKNITAAVWALPENLVYLIDAGRLLPNKSQIFDAAKVLRGDALLNELPDKKYTSETDKWGFIQFDSNPDQGLYINRGNERDWATSFITKGKENKNTLTYKLALQPGAYKITVAYVPSVKLSFASWLRVNNARVNTQTVKTTVSDDKIHPPVFVSHDLRLSEPMTITYETDKLAGQFWENASISLIAVEQISSDIAEPSISSTGGDFWESQTISLTHKDSNAEIYYTLDGSKPDRNSTKYSTPISLNKTTRLSSIACIDNKVSKVVTTDFAINTWATTVSEFKLVGQKDVNNVKVKWMLRNDANLYKVYRDGKLIGELRGDTYDDYDLLVGKTYVYYVEAYKDENKIAIAASQKATTFTSSDEVDIFDNKNGKYISRKLRSSSGGMKIGDIYLSYRMQKIEKEVNGKLHNGWQVTESYSKTGLNDSWSSPRELAFYPNVKFEGIAFRHNKKTDKVVLSAHYEDQNGYTAAKIYLAQITPKGDIEIGTMDRPLGYDSRDQSLFVDDDGTAYLLSATRTNNDINIYKLDETWTKPISLINTLFIGQHRETPAIIKKDGEYYFFSSKASGWYPSQTMYASSTDLSGVWTSLREIGNNSTFGAQANNIRGINGEKQTFGLWSYHWGAQYHHKDPDGNFPRISVVSFNEGYASMDYYRYVEFHEKYGLIPVQVGKNLTMNAPVKASVAAAKGGIADCVTDGASLSSSCYFQSVSYPYSLTIDMTRKSIISEINLSTRLVNGSETAYKYTIEGSLDGENYKILYDGTDNWQVGFQILDIKDQTAYRYLRLNVLRVINVHNNNSATWAEGIYEFVAFGKTQ